MKRNRISLSPTCKRKKKTYSVTVLIVPCLKHRLRPDLLPQLPQPELLPQLPQLPQQGCLCPPTPIRLCSRRVSEGISSLLTPTMFGWSRVPPLPPPAKSTTGLSSFSIASFYHCTHRTLYICIYYFQHLYLYLLFSTLSVTSSSNSLSGAPSTNLPLPAR